MRGQRDGKIRVCISRVFFAGEFLRWISDWTLAGSFCFSSGTDVFIVVLPLIPFRETSQLADFRTLVQM
jgi:hypothetical protein